MRPNIQKTIYNKFRGVDRASDPTDIDNSRSPYAPNLISGPDGFPEKRVGWRVLCSVDAPVNGIYYLRTGEESFYIIHGGEKLYRWDGTGEPVEIKSGINNGKSSGFMFRDEFYLFTGREYLTYTDGAVQDVKDVSYVPTIIISRNPSGGGTSLDPVNLLQKKRRVGFLPDGTSKTYVLPSSNIESVDEVKVGETARPPGDYTVDLATGKVTFTTAPKKPEEDGGVVGQDWVHITYSYAPEGYADRITRCNISTTYGYGTPDRVVASGNPGFRNTDWISGHNDPTYFPDRGYSNIGSSETAIMGYARAGEYQAIIKEENDQDNTIFFRHAALSGTEVIFPVRQAVVGIGMIAKGTVANIDDEPLFLSRSGIFAITSNNLTAERSVQNRSWYIDNALKAEPNLENAVAVSWNNQYLLCVNGNVYVLDANQNKTYQDRANGDYVYECYHWSNIPAACFLVVGDTLYFGTADGRVCRTNNDIVQMNRYSDGGVLTDGEMVGGEAIDAQWATKADDDGDFMTRKTMLKQGTGVQIKPFTRSSVDVTVRTDSDFGTLVRSATMDIFDWTDIDFERFTFNTLDTPQVVPLGAKVKNYVTLQFIARNNKINEGFGILGIAKTYVRGNFVR